MEINPLMTAALLISFIVGLITLCLSTATKHTFKKIVYVIVGGFFVLNATLAGIYPEIFAYFLKSSPWVIANCLLWSFFLFIQEKQLPNQKTTNRLWWEYIVGEVLSMVIVILGVGWLILPASFSWINSSFVAELILVQTFYLGIILVEETKNQSYFIGKLAYEIMLVLIIIINIPLIIINFWKDPKTVLIIVACLNITSWVFTFFSNQQDRKMEQAVRQAASS